MPHLPLRTIALPDATNRVYDAWLEEIGGRIAERGADWTASDPRRPLRALVSRLRRLRRAARAIPATPPAARVALLCARPAQHHARARVLRRRGPGALRPGEAAALALVRLRPLAARRAERAPGRAASAGCWRSHLFARCGRNFKCFQHVEFSFGYNMEVGDDVRGAPPRAARRPGRHHAGRPGEHLRLRQHLQPHPQHRGPEGRHQRAHRARGRRAHHLSRDGAGRRAGGPERDGGRQWRWPPRTCGPTT